MAGILKDKVAVITGAGRGLGQAFALRYAEEGARLFLPDISLERVSNTAAMIREKGGEAVGLETDISSEKSVDDMAEKLVRTYGRADILLNNAAICHGIPARPWNEWPVDLWDQFFNVNVKGTWLCCRAIAPLMIKQKSGKIINIGSNIIREQPPLGAMPYACTKAAIHQLTKCLARALGPDGINVNAIGPGFTVTEGIKELPEYHKMVEGAFSNRCLPRVEEPQDLVGAAVFLASKEADIITGQFLLVDGGSAFN
jgi:3-oxoacyl-[acyl-carrier protein] reductase